MISECWESNLEKQVKQCYSVSESDLVLQIWKEKWWNNNLVLHWSNSWSSSPLSASWPPSRHPVFGRHSAHQGNQCAGGIRNQFNLCILRYRRVTGCNANTNSISANIGTNQVNSIVSITTLGDQISPGSLSCYRRWSHRPATGLIPTLVNGSVFTWGFDNTQNGCHVVSSDRGIYCTLQSWRYATSTRKGLDGL